MTSDGKYPVQGCESLQLPIQMQLSGKRSTFSWFFVPFLESTSNFKHFVKNIIVTPNTFLKLQTVKILLRSLSKKRCFRTHFDSQHVKASVKSCEISMRFNHVFASFSGKLIWKTSPLLSGEMLGFSVQTLTSDGKYPVQGCENLQLPLQMQLSEKRKTFFGFFLPFLYSTWNFEHFERKDDRHS